MASLKIDSNRNRYASFSKNRRGDDNLLRKLGYTLDHNQELVYSFIDDNEDDGDDD